MESIIANVAQSGRVLIPAHFRKSLNIDIGDELIMCLNDGEIRLTPRVEAIKRSQELVAKHSINRGSSSIVDAFIKEKREEAKRELEQ